MFEKLTATVASHPRLLGALLTLSVLLAGAGSAVANEASTIAGP